MKSILFIDQYNKVGGGQNVLIDLINTCSQLGYDCTAAIPPGDYIQSRATAKFHYLPALSLTNSKKGLVDIIKLGIHYLKIRSLIAEIKKANIVYINGSRYFMLGYLLSKVFNKKFIYHIHIDLDATGKALLSAIEKEKSTSAIIFTSAFLQTEYISSIKTSKKEKLYVIEPCASERFSKDFEKRFKNHDGPCNFISIGRIIPEKGFETVLQTASQLVEHNFYIVGAPENDTEGYFKKLKNAAPANVKFAGSCTDIPGFIQNHNIHYAIIASKWEEPFGMVAIEAMLCSCITFVEKKGGLQEIASQTCAILFESQEALIRNIRKTFNATSESKTEIAHTQYTLTKSRFSREMFFDKVSAMLTGIYGKG